MEFEFILLFFTFVKLLKMWQFTNFYYLIKFLLQNFITMVDKGFAARLKILADTLDLKQHNIYKDMRTSSARVSNVFNSVNNPSYEFLQSFLNAYPNVNVNWLLTGEGKMLLDDNNVVREPDERIWNSADLRKRVDRIEGFLRDKFKDF